MRAILVLLLSLSISLALAGCADDAGDAGDDTITDPTDDGADTGAGNETSDGNETGDGNETADTNETGDGNETTDTEPVVEPVEVVNTTFDYSSGEAAGVDGTTETFEVPTGYGTLTLLVSVPEGEGGGLPTTNLNVNADLAILDPDGEQVHQGLPGAGETSTVETAAKPGTWTIRYTGTGIVQVGVVGQVSGAAEIASGADEGGA